MTDEQLLEELKQLKQSYTFTVLSEMVIDHAISNIEIVINYRKEKPE